MMNKYPVITLLALYDPDAIGIRTLATFVKEKEGITVNQIFFKNLFPAEFPYTQDELNMLIKLIKDLKTDLLGISIRSSSYKSALAIIERVRQEIKSIKIMIGGTHAIVSPKSCIELADIVCLGEGEYPVLEIVRNFFAAPSKIKDIPGLWVKDNGEVFKNSINELIDINELPVIDYSDNNKWYIENNQIDLRDPITESVVGEVFSSRGCPYHCTYCTNNILSKIMSKGKFVRLKSVDNVIKDILSLKEYFKNLKKVVFADEVFAFDKKWAVEFCEKYKSVVHLPFAALFHPNAIDESTILLLKSAGLTHARAGIQSGSEQIRKDLYKRNESNAKIISFANICHKAGVRLTFDTIVNNPYETEPELRESLDFYLSIPKPFELNMHSLVYFPDTELTNMALKDGIITEAHVEGATDEALRLNHVLLKNKAMIYNYKNNLFWNSIFSLTSKPFIPASFIKYLSRRKFLRHNPVHILRLAKLANIINIGFIGAGLLIHGEIGLKDAWSVIKKFSFTSSVNK